MGVQLKAMLPAALATGVTDNELSLHAIYGGKHALFIDVKNEVIHTPEQFVNLWLEGYMNYLRINGANKGAYLAEWSYYKNFVLMRDSPDLWNYVELFLMRTFLREYKALARMRPTVEKSTLWIGENKASYGLLVAPRFYRGEWENDKSEIRHFTKDYWTIGHVVETGLVIPSTNKRISFPDPESYLVFFEHSLVRGTSSPHQSAIAARYCDFARNAADVEKVPLLIPELRYTGLNAKHEYRLDFCIIDPFTMNRVGFELSPWSTHGQLAGTKNLTQKAINDQAKANFEKEMKKLKAYFKEHDISTLVYTDSDLADHDSVFADMAKYLRPVEAAKQLQLTIRDEFLAFKM